MKKVTIINQDSGYLMIDIANAFAGAGHEVTLITGRLVQRKTPLHPSVKLHHIVKYHRNSIPSRLYSWLVGFVQILFLVWFKQPKDHLFIVSNPPIAPLLPLFCRNSFSLLIYDVYPDALHEAGIAKNTSLVYRTWGRLNKKVYDQAYKIFALTDGMKSVLSNYVRSDKIKIVPIWTDNNFFKPVLPEENLFIKAHDLQNKFIVMYSGNIGFSGETEMLLNVAKEINDPEILFLIVGEGAKRQLIKERIKNEGIVNCMLLPWQETSMLPFSLSSASIAVVTLGRNISKLAIPSKTFNFLSVGAPILSIASPDSDLAILVNNNKVGRNFQHDQIADMRDFINLLKGSPQEHEKMKHNALRLAKEYSPKNAEHFVL